jgi:hypothetical protein
MRRAEQSRSAQIDHLSTVLPRVEPLKIFFSWAKWKGGITENISHGHTRKPSPSGFRLADAELTTIEAEG